MDPIEADELPNNTATEEDTLAWTKKRGRRVSFAAEMTSVHVFDRDDEDLETPPEPKPNEDENENDDVPRFFNDLEESEDSREIVSKDDDMFGRKPFLQPFESPSSGSGFGSATSNDEDDFFGPVSTEFIRPGRLSDSVASVASDDNHEVTMDSTAFSMHFRSLARSESGELQTPTGSRVNTVEKTPTEGRQGSSMELTRYDVLVPPVAVFVDKFSSGKDSNDMSLVEDNPRKYDYANISPRLDELMLAGVSTSALSDGIKAAKYPGNNTSSTKDDLSAALGNPNVHDSAIASGSVGEEILASSHSLVHLRESDSLLDDEPVTELPCENNNQSSNQHNIVMDLKEDPYSNHVAAQIPSIRNGKRSELSSPAPSIGLSTPKAHHSHIHSQGILLTQSEPTPRNSSGQKSQSHSPVKTYPSTSVEVYKNSHGNGRQRSGATHGTAMPEQSPSVAITSLVYSSEVKLAVEVANASGKSGLLFNQVGTTTELSYSAEKNKLTRVDISGVDSVSGNPVAGHSSIRSKLYSCILKSPQHGSPVSCLADQFLGMDEGLNIQKMTKSMDGKDLMLSDKLGGSLAVQAGIDTDQDYSLRKKDTLRLKHYGVSSSNVTPVPAVQNSSIMSKLSSCIVRTPLHGMPVSRLEEQFLSTDTEQSLQRKSAAEHFPNDVVIKSKGTTGMPSHLSILVEEEPQHLSTLERFSAMRSEDKFPSPSIKIPRTPDGMINTPKQHLVSGQSPHLRHSSSDELSGSSRRVNHDVEQDYHTAAVPSLGTVLYNNSDNKSNNTIKIILPSSKSPVFRSPSRFENTAHLELNQQNHVDKSVQRSPDDDGDSMEILSSGSYLNAVAQKLDTMFTEQNICSRSPLMLIDHLSSPIQAHPLPSVDSNGMVQPYCVQPLLKTESIMSSDVKSNLSDPSFAYHANADESSITVQTATRESSLSPFKEDGTYLKAPESSAHKRRRDEIVKGNAPSTSYIDKLKSPQNPKRGVTECVKLNDCSADDPSQCGRHDKTVKGNLPSTTYIDKLRNPKKPRKGVTEYVRLNDCSADDPSRRGSIVALRHWSDILSKALADTENSCPTLLDRLDLRKMELLEDRLIQLEKVQTVTRICNSIQTRSVGNHFNIERNRRISETMELLEKMLFEKAKLNLLQAKRENHLKRKKIIRSGVQQCQTLKLNCLQLRPCDKRGVNADLQPLTARLEEQQNVQVADNEVLKMRKKVGAIQRDIDSLVYSFHTCLKIKEKSTVEDTMTLIADRLKMRALFKSLRKDVQSWEIIDMVCEKGQNQISLNYQGYLTQRFTLVAAISTVTVSYELSPSNIEKKYHNMDAHIAFSWVFKLDVVRNYVGIRSLARETQVTSSILSSLLDVLDEVKLARLELKHLKEARFQSSSAEKLYLCLYFIDFKTGMKINLTFDVSCLSSGVYPSDIFPTQFQSHAILTSDSLPAGLRVAVENVKSGFSRILRICRCISKEFGSTS